MNKIKMFFLVTIVFLLSGCSFEYNINIDDNIITEDNVIYLKNSNFNNIEDSVNKIVNKYSGPTNSLGMYSSSIVERDNYFGMSYKKDYSFSDYNYSVSFSSCYDSYKLVDEGDTLTIATSNVFKCFDKYDELEDVTINLTTNYSVEESNADFVDGNKYTWYITKNNANQKSISIVVNISDSGITEKKSFNFNAFFLVLSVSLLVGIIILFIYLRNRKINRI